MPAESEIEAAACAMSASKAWPVVFQAGSARLLAIAALEAAERVRANEKGPGVNPGQVKGGNAQGGRR